MRRCKIFSISRETDLFYQFISHRRSHACSSGQMVGGHHVDQVVRRDGRVKRFRAIMFPGNRVGLVRYLPPGANHRRAAAGGVVRIRAAQRRQMLTTDALLPQQLAPQRELCFFGDRHRWRHRGTRGGSRFRTSRVCRTSVHSSIERPRSTQTTAEGMRERVMHVVRGMMKRWRAVAGMHHPMLRAPQHRCVLRHHRLVVLHLLQTIDQTLQRLWVPVAPRKNLASSSGLAVRHLTEWATGATTAHIIDASLSPGTQYIDVCPACVTSPRSPRGEAWSREAA